MHAWQVPAGQPLHVVVTAVAGPWPREHRYLLDLHTPAADLRLVLADRHALHTLWRAVDALVAEAQGLAPTEAIVSRTFAPPPPA